MSTCRKKNKTDPFPLVYDVVEDDFLKVILIVQGDKGNIEEKDII